VYHFPATKEVIEKIKKNPMVNEVRIEPAQIGPYDLGGSIFTLSDEVSWTRDDFGPLWIPCKGATIELNPANVLLYGRVICAYERHSLEERQGRYFVDGEPAEHYTFEMDYYWMMGDNRHNSADSRAWGFVPEDHVVGKPMRVWLSLDKDRNWFQGKIRWKRFMKKAV
jgi:signal peptidase I